MLSDTAVFLRLWDLKWSLDQETANEAGPKDRVAVCMLLWCIVTLLSIHTVKFKLLPLHRLASCVFNHTHKVFKK